MRGQYSYFHHANEKHLQHSLHHRNSKLFRRSLLHTFIPYTAYHIQITMPAWAVRLPWPLPPRMLLERCFPVRRPRSSSCQWSCCSWRPWRIPPGWRSRPGWACCCCRRQSWLRASWPCRRRRWWRWPCSRRPGTRARRARRRCRPSQSCS